MLGKFLKRTSHKVGLPPGTLVHVGEKRFEKVKITIIDYDDTQLTEKEPATVEECLPFKDKPTVTWLNVSGIHEIDIIERLGKAFEFHPLLLEDVVHADQRPKQEDYGADLFVVLKMLDYDDRTNETITEQVSLVVGENYVISFQESEGDVFNPVRERVRSGKGRIRKLGSDYLAYALIDAVVDNYFIVLEKVSEDLEVLQEKVLVQVRPETLQEIQHLKREMIFLRKSIWPMREAISNLYRAESPLVSDEVRLFFRDVYDHTIQVIDTIETFRDMISGVLDIYLSSVSNKMNEVMKVLTIIATIFIPLTFIAGIYGMNFEYMPELKWHWSYPTLWVAMLVVFAAMLLLFRRKKWL